MDKYNFLKEKKLQNSLVEFLSEDRSFRNELIELEKIMSNDNNLKLETVYDSEPMIISYELQNISNKKIKFDIYINIDKLYRILNKEETAKDVLINDIDMKEPLKSSGITKHIGQPVILCKGTIRDILGLSKYYSLDGRNRIKQAYNKGKSNILAYIVDDSLIEKTLMNDKHRLAFKVLKRYINLFGIG